MRVVYFAHSLASCWNHGNAHFLRGVLSELIARGHETRVFEPAGAWSLENLLADHGPAGLDAYRAAYPELASEAYGRELDVERALAGADLVLVHEWNEPWLVAAAGRARRQGGRFTLLFHDTHHRAVSEPEAMRAYDLDGYDGVLAFGEALAEVYRRRGWGDRVFTWHEAADTRLFRPVSPSPLAREGREGGRDDDFPSPLRGGVRGGGRDDTRPSQGEARASTLVNQAPSLCTPRQVGAPPLSNSPPRGGRECVGVGGTVAPPHPDPLPPGERGTRQGLVWIGNWGDGERSAELEAFLFRPAQATGLSLDVYGVRYPEAALATLARYGARYHGWLPNARAPEVFARHLATVHVPRRFYAQTLPGIPTIRVFEALACGIPLVSAPWEDSEGLFRPGRDYLVARDEAEMVRHLAAVRDDAGLRDQLVRDGLATIRARHTCARRVDELLAIVARLRAPAAMELSA